MRTVLRVIKTLVAVALVAAFAFFLLVAANTFKGTLLEDIASRIPLLRTFIVKTFPTYLYGKTYEDTGVLKVARYDIDYLASFTGRDGRYVALYPFTVEAEVPLDRILKDEVSGKLLVPSIEYRSSLDEETAASMVFMNTLELDYNRMLAPVLAMYHEKSVDFAMEDRAFTEDCRTRSEKYITDLLGETGIAWIGGDARDGDLDAGADDTGGAEALTAGVAANSAGAEAVTAGARTASRFLPVAFLHAADRGRTRFAEGASLRDAFAIRTARFDSPECVSYRFGKAGTMLGSFGDFAKALCDFSPIDPSPHVVFAYHDPVHPADMTFASYADEGYRNAFVYLRGTTDVYYLESVADRAVNDEAFARNVSPNVLYLAASATPAGAVPELAGSYDGYWRSYENALNEIKKRRYGRQLALSLGELDRIALERTGKASGDAAIVRGILDFKEGDIDLLEMLASPETELASDDELGGNVAALFWMMRDEIGLTDEEAEGYRRDLLGKGAALNRELVESLGPEERNILYRNFFESHIPAEKARSAYVDENGLAETWLYYGKAATEWKEETSQIKVAEKLSANGMERGGKFIFVFAEPEDEAGFFTDYHALAFDGESVAYYKNFARWLKLFGAPAASLFTDVTVVDGSFAIGKKTVVGQGEIASLLSAFSKAFSSDNYNRDRVIELLSRNLEDEAFARLDRPSWIEQKR